MPKGYEDLNWEERERFHRRAASLNTLAALFGIAFSYVFETEEAHVFVKGDHCLVPRKDWGQP